MVLPMGIFSPADIMERLVLHVLAPADFHLHNSNKIFNKKIQFGYHCEEEPRDVMDRLATIMK